MPVARRRGLAVLAVGALVAAACGGGGKKAANTTVPEESTTTSSVAAGDSSTTASTATANGSSTTTTAKASSSGTKTTTKTTLKKTVTGVGTKQTVAVGPVTVNSSPPATAPPQAARGGKLSWAMFSEVRTLDPALLSLSGGADGNRAYGLFDDLIYNGSDGNVSPGIASAVTSNDGIVWTVKLRSNVKFSDGKTLNSAAVKAHWDRIGTPATASPALTQVTAMSKYETPDDLTIVVTLKVQNNQWPRTLGGILGLIPSPGQSANDLATKPIGAGPFKLQEWNRDDHMTVVRNDGYWNQPYPFLDELTYKVITDDTQRSNTYIAGQSDMIITLSVPEADHVRKAGNSNEATVDMNGGNILVFNTTKAPFNNVKARQAIAYALDSVRYNQEVNGGLNTIEDTMFVPGSPYYDPSIKTNIFDPKKAQDLLDEIKNTTGQSLKFTLMTYQTTGPRAQAEWMQGQLMQYKNIDVSIEVNASPTTIGKVLAKNYDAAIYGVQFVDPDSLYVFYRSDAGATNVTGYNNSTVDAALLAGRNTFDAQARVNAYKTVQQQVTTEVPGWFYHRPHTFIFGRGVIYGMKSDLDGMLRTWELYVFKQ